MSIGSWSVARFVTVMLGTVIGSTFLFGFGNVLNLALKLGVPVLVAPLIALAVDLTVLGLLIGTRHLALSGASEEVLRPARRLLLAASLVTLLLNVADPLSTGDLGKAAFDSVGPLLLIGWAETGPGLLRALGTVNADILPRQMVSTEAQVEDVQNSEQPDRKDAEGTNTLPHRIVDLDAELTDRARHADSEHWRQSHRPISAETLRKQLCVGASKSRALVAVLRAESTPAAATGAESQVA